MPKRLDESAAIAAMRNANFEPLEPYSLSKTPWKSKCLQCENVCYPILSNIKSGKRGCTTCGSKESGRKTSIRKRMPKNELDQILSDKSVELLSAFETTKDVLLFRCLLCGEEFFSQVRYIQKFKLNGCPECRKTIPKVKKNRFIYKK